MADSIRPLTLLLGAVCLWALSVLVLAAAGLGTRFPPVAGVANPPPLPTVSLTRSVSRLDALGAYAEVGARPLMNLSRRPVATAAMDASASADLDVMLTSVLITPRLQLAILTDNKDGGSRRVRVGEMVEGSNWRLVQLEPRRATIEGPSGQRTLDLRVFDGASGEMPTPLDSPPRAATPSPAPSPSSPAAGAAVDATPNPGQVVNAASKAEPEPVTVSQEAQVEAIRRRIEARRAQMRAEAESDANDK